MRSGEEVEANELIRLDWRAVALAAAEAFMRFMKVEEEGEGGVGRARGESAAEPFSTMEPVSWIEKKGEGMRLRGGWVSKKRGGEWRANLR